MTHPNGKALGGDVGSLLPAAGGTMTTIVNSSGSASTLWSGTGVPASAMGNNGDFYLRSDAPGTANQRIYVKAAGAWTGVV